MSRSRARHRCVFSILALHRKSGIATRGCAHVRNAPRAGWGNAMDLLLLCDVVPASKAYRIRLAAPRMMRQDVGGEARPDLTRPGVTALRPGGHRHRLRLTVWSTCGPTLSILRPCFGQN